MPSFFAKMISPLKKCLIKLQRRSFWGGGPVFYYPILNPLHANFKLSDFASRIKVDKNFRFNFPGRRRRVEKVEKLKSDILQYLARLIVAKLRILSGPVIVDGRAVASDTRGPRFESSDRQYFIHVFCINCIEKTKIKIQEAGNGPLKKNTNHILVQSS